MPGLGEQTLEPMNGACCFDAHAYRFWRTLQTPVERLSFAAFMVQSPLDEQLLVSSLAMAIC